MLAKAAEMRARETSDDDWIPVAKSPLGKRRTLALAREGRLESSKVGRKVLIRASSLRDFIEKHERAEPAADEEDLFGPTKKTFRSRSAKRAA